MTQKRRFIMEKKNVVMVGNPGRGKTHMAIGLGLKACALGMSVLFLLI
jgi:DNA replication protein DnaC